MLFEFEDKVEADLVLLRGSRCLKKVFPAEMRT